jgi:5'-nucleotidase
MGRLELEVLPGQKPQLRNYRLLPLDDGFADDPSTAAIVEKWRKRLPPERVLGQLLAPLDTRSKIKGGGESAAGNFFTNAMLAYFSNQADLAFVHMGTLRGDRIYPAGNFTNHDLSEYHPFDNTPMLMEITAPQLKIILERGVRELPVTVGAFLSLAGLRVVIDPTRRAQTVDPTHPRILFPGKRVLRAEFRGQAIDFSDEQRTFNIVTDGYMGRGGAGYFTLKEAKNIRQASVGASDVLKWYLEKFSPIDPSPNGRISILRRDRILSKK